MKKNNIRKILFATAAILLAFSTWAGAFTCHCFNQRDFDPANPASADPYILATAGNSLLAGSVGLEKSPVVKMRMGGVEEPDLWIALHAAKATGRDGGLLLDEKTRSGSWANALRSQGFDPQRFGAPFWAALESDERGAARILADHVLAATFGATPGEVAALRAAQATTPEACVALFLKHAASRDPLSALKEVRDGRATWGSLLTAAGVAPRALSARIMALARPPG